MQHSWQTRSLPQCSAAGCAELCQLAAAPLHHLQHLLWFLLQEILRHHSCEPASTWWACRYLVGLSASLCQPSDTMFNALMLQTQSRAVPLGLIWIKGYLQSCNVTETGPNSSAFSCHLQGHYMTQKTPGTFINTAGRLQNDQTCASFSLLWDLILQAGLFFNNLELWMRNATSQ